MFEIKAVCISGIKGVKCPVKSGNLIENYGFEGDYHAKADSDRQVSILLESEIDRIIKLGYTPEVGAFGENLIVSGVDLNWIKPGGILTIDGRIILKVMIIGKECHAPCIIKTTTGICIMPESGIFCRVVKGGCVKNGDRGSYSK